MATSKTRVNIEVTDQDIERAHRNDSYTCVVAQAVARTIPDAMRIEVDTQTIRFTNSKGERMVYLTPYAVQGYVIAFDAGDPIESFSFQLRNPIRASRKVLTEAGRAVKRVEMRTRRERTKNDDAKQVVTKASKQAVTTTADDPVESVKAAFADSKLSESDRAGRRTPPRVFKKKSRAYGHRLLRINQQDNIPF